MLAVARITKEIAHPVSIMDSVREGLAPHNPTEGYDPSDSANRFAPQGVSTTTTSSDLHLGENRRRLHF